MSISSLDTKCQKLIGSRGTCHYKNDFLECTLQAHRMKVNQMIGFHKESIEVIFQVIFSFVMSDSSVQENNDVLIISRLNLFHK